MEAPTSARPAKINRWLPYYAVFQADLHQTLTSWVYRVWVLVSVLAATGYLLYRVGIQREAGIVQNASILISDLLRWTLLGSITLIIILTVGSISGERGTLADSVLSRGISRYQYFFGKWHARLVALLGTFLVLGFCGLVAAFFLVHEDLSLFGCLWALLTLAAVLAAVISCGVAFSALFSSTLVGVATLWVVLYGSGFLLSLLPSSLPSPDRALASLPDVLRGFYDLNALVRLMAWSGIVALVAATVGMVHFARRDV
jgi:ABC-2 type transport system permease protein